MLVSVVIPCYNEENRIAPTLEEVKRYFRRRGFESEIIVVNDGSKDNTLEIIKSFENLKVVSWSENRGKGSAVKAGLETALGDYVLITDADLSTPIEEADKLFALLRHYDIVIGSRQSDGAVIQKYQPLHRLILGMIFGFTVRTLFSMKYHDTQCGFKAMTLYSAKVVSKKLTIRGFTCDVEMLAIADNLGLNVAEVGVRWRDMRGSKLKPVKHFKSIITELIQIKKNYPSSKKQIKFFRKNTFP